MVQSLLFDQLVESSYRGCFCLSHLFSNYVDRSSCFVHGFRHLRFVTVYFITVQRDPNRPPIFFGYGWYCFIVIVLSVVDITVNVLYCGPRLVLGMYGSR
jgi:hypothetical protein